MAYNVYSLPDVKSVLYHPDVGTANLHLCGIGKITVSSAGTCLRIRLPRTGMWW